MDYKPYEVPLKHLKEQEPLTQWENLSQAEVWKRIQEQHNQFWAKVKK